jgi:hypothetical protein
MPSVDPTKFANAWKSFVEALEKLLRLPNEDRPLDQFYHFRDEVLTLVKSGDFGQELQKSLTDLTRAASNDPDQAKQTTRIVEVLLLELEASARAAEITLHAQDRDGKRSWVRRMLGRGSVATGSVKDILDDLLKQYPLLKGGLTLFGELLDIFKED